ncbi:hypothetical protein Tco_1198986 [Tanacetum coccineum]
MEETMEANRESDIRERMQLLFSQLMESVSNLHEALIWELPAAVGSNRFGIDPLSMYTNGAEINQVQWFRSKPDWIVIDFDNKLHLLKVYGSI